MATKLPFPIILVPTVSQVTEVFTRIPKTSKRTFSNSLKFGNLCSASPEPMNLFYKLFNKNLRFKFWNVSGTSLQYLFVRILENSCITKPRAFGKLESFCSEFIFIASLHSEICIFIGDQFFDKKKAFLPPLSAQSSHQSTTASSIQVVCISVHHNSLHSAVKLD